MTLYIISFLSGVLTILAPCVLPVLPVIIGGSIQQGSLKKTLIICLSFMASIVAFTFLLKATSLLIGIDPIRREILSGSILIGFGLLLLFPFIREYIAHNTGLSKSNMLVREAKSKGGVRGDVLLGAALGPVFSTCSPTYALILAVILPISLVQGTISIIFYALGIGLMLFAVSAGGISVVKRVKRLADPKGRFKRFLALLIILAGIGVLTGYDKKLQVLILDAGFFDITKVEQMILDPYIQSQSKDSKSDANILSNVEDFALFNTHTPAPEIIGLTNWINFSGVQSLDELKGKVILVDFWTYSCINCQRTLPYLQKWHERYADEGLVILGVHAPEFQFEKDPRNVMKAVQQFGITYPVAQDNDFKTWRNFKNQYRPAKYIIDAAGNVRYTHFGEGKYAETEQVIQKLLEDVQMKQGNQQEKLPVLNLTERDGFDPRQTAETYLGVARRQLVGTETRVAVRIPDMSIDQPYAAWWTDGERKDSDEHIALLSQTGTLTIRGYAREVNLVLGPGESAQPVQAEVLVDGILTKKIMIDQYNLYQLMNIKEYGNHTIQLKFSNPGVEAYAYTFG